MTDQIAEGRKAWQRVTSATDFASWKAIAVAISIGRQHALRMAGINAPHGTRYSKAFLAWLEENGFRQMPHGLRAKCCLLADNLAEIEQWRAGLSVRERDSQNHPGSDRQELAPGHEGRNRAASLARAHYRQE